MDEQQFDDLIQSSLEDFPVEFDPAALEQFHQLQDGAALVPWWKRALPWAKWGLWLLILLTNIGLLWAFLGERDQVAGLEQKVLQLESEQLAQQQIQPVIMHRVDTVYVVQEQRSLSASSGFSFPAHQRASNHYALNNSESSVGLQPNNPSAQLDAVQPTRSSQYESRATNPSQDNNGVPTTKAASLKAEKAAITAVSPSNRDIPTPADRQPLDAIAQQNNNLPPSSSEADPSSLLDAGVPSDDQNEQTAPESDMPDSVLTQSGDSLSPHLDTSVAEEDSIPVQDSLIVDDLSEPGMETEEVKIRTPLSFQTGVVPALYFPSTARGNGLISMGIGIHTELFLSQHFRFLAGVEAYRPRYDIDDPSNPESGFDLSLFPEFDWLTLDFMEQVQVRSNVLAVPLNLEYAMAINDDSRLILGAGWTPHLFWYQYFNYRFNEGGNEFSNSREVRSLDWYRGTANGTLDVEWMLPRNYRLRFGGFFRYGLGTMGSEQQDYSISGVRASFWFGW